MYQSTKALEPLSSTPKDHLASLSLVTIFLTKKTSTLGQEPTKKLAISVIRVDILFPGSKAMERGCLIKLKGKTPLTLGRGKIKILDLGLTVRLQILDIMMATSTQRQELSRT